MGGDACVGSAHAGPAGAQCAVVVVPPCRFGAFCGDGALVAVVAAGVFEAGVAGVDGFAGPAVAVEQPWVGGAALRAGVPVAVVVGEATGVVGGLHRNHLPWMACSNHVGGFLAAATRGGGGVSAGCGRTLSARGW